MSVVRKRQGDLYFFGAPVQDGAALFVFFNPQVFPGTDAQAMQMVQGKGPHGSGLMAII